MLARILNDFSPLMQLHDRMNDLFESFFEDLPALRPYGASYPGVNLWEDGENGYVEAELPGMALNDVEVYVLGNQLTLSGRRQIPDQPQAQWHRRERSQGQFSRTFTLPWEIDADKVEARLQEGVLTVRLPKTETAKPKKVQVLTA